MSIHISNDDVATGTSYDGVFNLVETLQGTYVLSTQYIDETPIPWMWSGVHQLRIFSFGTLEEDTAEGTITFDYATIGQSEDTTVIANSIETSINLITEAFPLESARTVAVTYGTDTIGSYYQLDFTGVAENDVILEFEDVLSTSKYVFNELEDIEGASIKIYTTFMNIDPKFLEMYIDESSSEYNTSRNTYPTILLSTNDFEFTGQQINFLNNTNTLTMSIYRTNIQILPVPITNRWDLVMN